jgi:hypothetical protein
MWASLPLLPLTVAAVAGLSACGSGQDAPRVDAAARVVELPGAAREIDFDDIVYSGRLKRLLVPAGRSGLYLVEPDSGDAKQLGRLPNADSADEGRGLVFVLRRDERVIDVVNPTSGRVVSSVTTAASGDYVRYVASTGELWVTQPDASPPGIEIFTLPDGATPKPRRAAFIAVPGGTEGIAVSSRRRIVYTHAGVDLVAIDVPSRTVTRRWSTGCDGTHGFPRVDERDGLLLASCADDGEVALLDVDNGRQLARYVSGGGEALTAYSSSADHFYVRGDPGTKLATLTASKDGLALVDEVEVPDVGHCLTADGVGHYWTCDAEDGRVLRFNDPEATT